MRVRPAGPDAVLLEMDDAELVGADAGAVVEGWRAQVRELVARGSLPRPDDVVPGARTLLLDGVPASALAGHLTVLEAVAASPGSSPAGRQAPVVEVPVTYDGADLEEVARRWGTDVPGLVAHHTGTPFRVAFCGFAPGFPYLLPVGGSPVEGPGSAVPRRSSPRPSVPAGSVALAGRYCGIYPSASPGGWQVLGTTDLSLFDPGRQPPALLAPGTGVRFVEAARAAPAPPGASRPQSPVEVGPVVDGRPGVEVLRPGALTTVQDGGRRGQAHLGVPAAGALDAPAARLANRLVGNPEHAAVLETTLDGVRLRTLRALTVAVTGALAPVSVGGRARPWGQALTVRAGEEVAVGAATAGVRCYVAVRGGVTVPPLLGSRSRDTLAGLGPPPLAAGQVLPVGPAPDAPVPPVDFGVPARVPAEVVLRVVPGPRDDWFGAEGLAALATTAWSLSPLGNRVGARLTGPALPRVRTGELESEGIVAGSVQVPPDGQPVVLLADHPTTGGYPVVGVVLPPDLATLAQARPGTPVRFVLLPPPAAPTPTTSSPPAARAGTTREDDRREAGT